MLPKTTQLVVPEVARSWIINTYIKTVREKPLVIVTRSVEQAELLESNLIQVNKSIDIEVLPSWESFPLEKISPQTHIMGKRNKVLWRLRKQEYPDVIIATARSISQVITNQNFESTINIQNGYELSYEGLIDQLSSFGYKRTTQVERCGEFSIRGSIIDVYPSTYEAPIRLEMWGDEVERLTTFSTRDQLSKNPLSDAQIFPASELCITDDVKSRAHELSKEMPWGSTFWEMISEGGTFDGVENLLPWLNPKRETILDLLPSSALVLLFDAKQIQQRIENLISEEQSISMMLSETLSPKAKHGMQTLHITFEEAFLREKIRTVEINSSSADLMDPDITVMTPERRITDPLQILKGLVQDGYNIVLLSESDKSIKALNNKLLLLDLNPVIHSSDSPIEETSGISLISGVDISSVIFPELKFAIINERELSRRRKSPRKVKRKSDAPGSTFMDLKEGAFVVHEHHGIAIFRGIVKRSLADVERDYLLLEYRKGDKLYVPTDQVYQISQYNSGGAPSLSRMGGSDWTRTRSSIRNEIEKIAEDLVELYQQRESQDGFSFSTDSPWQLELEESFPFIETNDQVSAMNDVKSDMERKMPMDRLVCGDVGFGKTEIALRAAFKAAQDSKQVAVLVPTTLLAQQHYQTFSERLAPFPIQVAVLSRFLTNKETKQVISKLHAGEIDLIIGTHRLLSEDIKFKDLGLLIIDEEQRFGVTHKEKIKSLRTNVDVLTLTATPIPRTLEMSLTGIRDLTLLNTPPTDRKPIMTFVGEYENSIVSSAIRREILRDGQVFFVHNKVSDIEVIADKLREQIPSARIATAHGQMDEGLLEQTVIDFWEKKYDVLVCTTIIESGIDMPSVNTLIVDNADRMGLGQLHQLRGRVGRSGTKAYAYLLTPKGHNLTEDAVERLKTVGETSELGSGFKIAMRDLEIRGAGNLLGTGQSGHIAAVGYDLYCKLVKEAVEELKHVPKENEQEIEIEIPMTAYIPKDYIMRDDSKLESYRSIADIKNNQDLERIQQTWLDRYGPVPEEATNLLKIAHLKLAARSLGIQKIIAKKIPGFGKAEWNIHLRPLLLRPSQRVRTLRLYEGSLYKEDKQELILKISEIREASQEITDYLKNLEPVTKEA